LSTCVSALQVVSPGERDVTDLYLLRFSSYSARHVSLYPSLLLEPQDLPKNILRGLRTIRKRALFEREDNRQLVGWLR
jgi:hypothetical protein